MNWKTPSWLASMFVGILLAGIRLGIGQTDAAAAEPGPSKTRGDELLATYFKAETESLAESCLADIHSLADWQARREQLRGQLFEMLSLAPLPPRTDLKPEITGVVEHDSFVVEKLHFQSMPGLYVTANLYLPKGLDKPAPAILYVCGHAIVITNGVSYGNKTGYQHHGAWFARNGYVCLTIDTIQLGEIQGLHHGTYRQGMWWWNSRGYTPAGVEAWNCMRALDYLQSRPEVDGTRLGVTGRSGGGAYSWWAAALDDRIKAAAPVAGITDLKNHVVDGTVDGHCDCMFTVNTYRWDYPLLAALVAPRPLLICNSDKDYIFPLDGVVRLHAKAARIYKMYRATNHLGLIITEGPHKDTQELQLPVFRWFNRHLKGTDPVIEMAATRFFTPQELKVFPALPEDEQTTSIHKSFVPMAAVPGLPLSPSEWVAQRDSWKTALTEQVFRGWPRQAPPLDLLLRARHQAGDATLAIYEFTSQHDVPLRLYFMRHEPEPAPRQVRLVVRNESEWARWVNQAGATFPNALRQEIAELGTNAVAQAAPFQLPAPGEIEACFAPRGVGWNGWSSSQRRSVQIRRRFMLLGQTVDGMRVWDVRRAIEALGLIDGMLGAAVTVEANGEMAVNCLYAALFQPTVRHLRLDRMPASHMEGPDYLNVLRFMDVPQTLAMAAESCQVELRAPTAGSWDYPRAVATKLGWPKNQLQILSITDDAPQSR